MATTDSCFRMLAASLDVLQDGVRPCASPIGGMLIDTWSSLGQPTAACHEDQVQVVPHGCRLVDGTPGAVACLASASNIARMCVLQQLV